MLANDLRKGAHVRLRNGWEADVADNAKGSTRMCKVYGFETEIGSVYTHDIVAAVNSLGVWERVELSERQAKQAQKIQQMMGAISW